MKCDHQTYKPRKIKCSKKNVTNVGKIWLCTRQYITAIHSMSVNNLNTNKQKNEKKTCWKYTFTPCLIFNSGPVCFLQLFLFCFLPWELRASFLSFLLCFVLTGLRELRTFPFKSFQRKWAKIDTERNKKKETKIKKNAHKSNNRK